MEEAGLVARTREDEDRRMVRSRITATGLELLSVLDDVVIDEHKRRFEHLSQEQLRTLIDLLTAIRQKP
jgi:DNA-binding MarR family transcriptional regulator